MFEIFILVAIAVAMAAHKGRPRRRFRPYLRGEIDIDLPLSTLGSGVLIGTPVAGTVVEKTYISSVRLTWSLKAETVIAADGPITVGVAHSDYTDAEVEEVIENAGSWTQGDKVAQEKARRQIRIVGTFPSTLEAAAAQNVVLNDGKPITTKLGWTLVTGQTIKVWAFNTGGSAMTGTAIVFALGHANLWPQ